MLDESSLNQASPDIPVQYEPPPESVHSNCLVVEGADCMYLHFFQIRPPVLVSSQNGPPAAIADSVASIAVSFDRMQDFIDVMQKQLDLVKSAINTHSQGGPIDTPEEIVSGADLAMEDFSVTERDAAEVRLAIASRQARPKFAFPALATGIQ